MELQEFITNTLESIINGVKNANKNLGNNNHYRITVGNSGEVLFDIAITVSEEAKKSGSGGIKVAVLNIGGEKEKSNIQENISRIKCKIQPDKTIS